MDNLPLTENLHGFDIHLQQILAISNQTTSKTLSVIRQRNPNKTLPLPPRGSGTVAIDILENKSTRQGRRKLVKVRETGSKIQVQDGRFLVNFIVDNAETILMVLQLWLGILLRIANLFITRLNTIIKCCSSFKL